MPASNRVGPMTAGWPVGGTWSSRTRPAPQPRELARLVHQDAVAGGESVDQRRFPVPSPGGRENDDRAAPADGAGIERRSART